MNRWNTIKFTTSRMALGLIAGVVCSTAMIHAAAPDGWDLIFSDDFDRAELGEDWQIVEGTWDIEEGELVGSGTLVSSKGFPGSHPIGFLRMEFKARTDVRPFILMPGLPPPTVSVSDISSFIHAQPPEAVSTIWRSGYFFQFGGHINTRNRIRRAGNELVVDANPENMIVPDQPHHVIVENDQGTLRMFVDGKKIFEHQEPASIMGDGFDRVGFYFYTQARVEQVRVYVKRLPCDLDLD